MAARLPLNDVVRGRIVCTEDWRFPIYPELVYPGCDYDVSWGSWRGQTRSWTRGYYGLVSTNGHGDPSGVVDIAPDAIGVVEVRPYFDLIFDTVAERTKNVKIYILTVALKARRFVFVLGISKRPAIGCRVIFEPITVFRSDP